MLRYSGNKGCFCTFVAVSVMAPVGLWGRKGSSLLTFGEKRRKAEDSTPHCFINRSELGKVGGLVIGAQRRASIFRFRSAHNGKSFGIAANAKMTYVLPGVKSYIRCGSCYEILLFLPKLLLYIAMAQLGSSLEGRLRNTDLPISKCLFPVFEAVVNSIYAIDDRLKSDNTFAMADGKIRIILDRANESDLFGGKAELLSITIEDNGIGFNENNYNSFCELDSLYRESLGCKGIGRLLWLKAFDSAEIESSYVDGSEMKCRHFIFTSKGIDELAALEFNDKELKTKVRMNGIKPRFKESLSKLSQESIAKAIFEHCLWFFIREGGCPDIRVIDGTNPATNLSEIYDSYMGSDNSEIATFSLGEETFNVLHIKLQRSDKNNNVISYCAGNRIVNDEKIKDVVGLYDSAIQTESKSFFYKCFVTAPYLDKHVAPDRFSFLIPDKRENDGDELYSEIYFSDIRSKVLDAIRQYLAPFLRDAIEAGKEKIQDFVDKQAPYYKPILASLSEDEKSINPNSSNKVMDLLLHQKMMEKEHRLLAEGHDVLEVKSGESDEEYQRRTQAYFDGIQSLKQSDLTRYVIHRKIILELLKDALSRNDDGHYSKEDKIHQIIMPMRTTSDGDEFKDNNLWIIDERLVFHHFLASDKSFNSMPVTDCGSPKRPDILVENVYDNPMVVTEKDNPPFASLRIVEFKRPMRDDMSADNDPINQCIDYVKNIRQGNAVTKSGRPLDISEATPAYCYIICDLTKSMRDICQNHDLKDTYDRLGYFGYHSGFRIYFEVISFDQLLNSASERNASFFDKLGISHN